MTLKMVANKVRKYIAFGRSMQLLHKVKWQHSRCLQSDWTNSRLDNLLQSVSHERLKAIHLQICTYAGSVPGDKSSMTASLITVRVRNATSASDGSHSARVMLLESMKRPTVISIG